MSSVMTPVNVRVAGAANNVVTATLAIRAVARTIVRHPEPTARSLSWRHQMGAARAGIHDPDAALRPARRQIERLRRRAGHADRHVRASVVLVGAHEMVEDRAELRLDAC